jgi:hypothetical protein
MEQEHDFRSFILDLYSYNILRTRKDQRNETYPLMVNAELKEFPEG